MVGLLQSLIGWAVGPREVFFFLLVSKVGDTFLWEMQVAVPSCLE